MTSAPPSPRVAIVTGAGRGIGAAVATRLAADGFAVGVLDLTEDSCADTVKAITGVGGTAVAVGADVSSADDAAAAVEKVASALGSPTVLVNNAGITRDNLLFKMTEADWDSVISVHLRGTFLMSRAVQKFMVAAGGAASSTCQARRPSATAGSSTTRPPRRAAGPDQDAGHRAWPV